MQIMALNMCSAFLNVSVRRNGYSITLDFCSIEFEIQRGCHLCISYNTNTTLLISWDTG